jgi:protoheme IX farnesyltransferase
VLDRLETAAPSESLVAARVRNYMELTKPGITRMVVLTSAVGFFLASPRLDVAAMLNALLGIALAASGCNAINQYVERDLDARMHRTRQRPLPSGRVSAQNAFVFSWGLFLAGLSYLFAFSNPLTAVLVASTLVSYIFIYTPLKRRTPYATLIGAVPGALPILAGWTAGGGALDVQGWTLFAILFLWQMPHFFALAWIYRDDYRRGGFRMLSVLDSDGSRTGTQIFSYAVLLVLATLMPALLDKTGPLYVPVAAGLGLLFLGVSVLMMWQRTERRAWRVFIASVLYLPALLLLMVIDRAIYPV